MWEREPKLCKLYIEAKAPDLIDGTIYTAAWPTWVLNCQNPIQTSGCGNQFAKMGRLRTMSMYYSMLMTDLLSVIELSP